MPCGCRRRFAAGKQIMTVVQDKLVRASWSLRKKPSQQFLVRVGLADGVCALANDDASEVEAEVGNVALIRVDRVRAAAGDKRRQQPLDDIEVFDVFSRGRRHGGRDLYHIRRRLARTCPTCQVLRNIVCRNTHHRDRRDGRFRGTGGMSRSAVSANTRSASPLMTANPEGCCLGTSSTSASGCGSIPIQRYGPVTSGTSVTSRRFGASADTT